MSVVKDRPIMSVKYCLSVPGFSFSPKLLHPAARSLCQAEHPVSDVAIFAELIENKCVIERQLRDINALSDSITTSLRGPIGLHQCCLVST